MYMKNVHNVNVDKMLKLNYITLLWIAENSIDPEDQE